MTGASRFLIGLVICFARRDRIPAVARAAWRSQRDAHRILHSLSTRSALTRHARCLISSERRLGRGAGATGERDVRVSGHSGRRPVSRPSSTALDVSGCCGGIFGHVYAGGFAWRAEELHMFSIWSALGPHARGLKSKRRCFPTQERDRGDRTRARPSRRPSSSSQTASCRVGCARMLRGAGPGTPARDFLRASDRQLSSLGHGSGRPGYRGRACRSDQWPSLSRIGMVTVT